MFFSVLPEICDIECDTHYLLDSYTEFFFSFFPFLMIFFTPDFSPKKSLVDACLTSICIARQNGPKRWRKKKKLVAQNVGAGPEVRPTRLTLLFSLFFVCF